MARMPDQLQQVRSPRSGGTARMPDTDQSGFRAVGAALDGIVDAEIEKRDRKRAEDDALALSTAVSRLRAAQTERLIRDGNALEDDAIEGFSDRFAGGVDEAAQIELALLPERVRTRAEAEFNDTRESLRLRALDVEFGRRDDRQGRLLGDNLQALGATVYHDATQFDESLERGFSAIDSSGLSEGAKAQARDALPGVLAGQRMTGLVESNPYLAREELAGGEWDEEMSVEAIARFRDQAQREIDRREAEAERRRAAALARAQASMRITMEDDLASILNTGQGVGLQLHNVERTFGPEVAERYMSQRREAEDTHRMVSGWRVMSAAEIERQVRALAPRPGQNGYVAASERYSRIAEVAEGMIARRREDPAGAALAADPVLNQSFEDMSRVPPAGRRAAVAQLREQQTRLGIPPAAQRVTTNAQAEAYAARLRGASESERTRALEEISDDVAAVYGAQAPRALAEIARVAEMPELGAIAAAPDAASRRRLARALTSPEPTLADGQTRSINRTIASEFGPLRESLAGVPGGIERVEQAQTAARRAAALAVASGQSPEAAAREAARIYTGQYQFRSGVRMPRQWRGEAMNGARVMEGAEQLREEIAESGAFRLPAGRSDVAEDDQRRAAIDSFRLTSRWVASPNDEGLVLVDNFGDAIAGAGGEPITASWDQALEARTRANQRMRERQIEQLLQR